MIAPRTAPPTAPMPLASPFCLTGVIAVTLPQSGQICCCARRLLPSADASSARSARCSATFGASAIASVAVFAALPPGPLHISVWALAPADEVVTCWLPLNGCVPLQVPLAVQAVALVADQVRLALSPAFTDVGLTEMVIDGAACS